MIREATYAVALFAALALSFAVGRSYGLKSAPEYVAAREARDAAAEASLAALTASWEASSDATCEKIFDLVQRDLMETDTYPPERR